MKTRSLCGILLVAAGLFVTISARLTAQTEPSQKPVAFTERNLSGPRLGITFIPGDGDIVRALESKGIGRVISQFGWHFEHQLTPHGGGPSFVIEWIPLVAGVEYGKFIPSLTLALGIRLPNGFEFGLGPNILATKAITEQSEDVFSTALVIAVGKSFDFGGVSIPVNLAYVKSPMGARIGLIFGYAIERSSN